MTAHSAGLMRSTLRTNTPPPSPRLKPLSAPPWPLAANTPPLTPPRPAATNRPLPGMRDRGPRPRRLMAAIPPPFRLFLQPWGLRRALPRSVFRAGGVKIAQLLPQPRVSVSAWRRGDTRCQFPRPCPTRETQTLSPNVRASTGTTLAGRQLAAGVQSSTAGESLGSPYLKLHKQTAGK